MARGGRSSSLTVLDFGYFAGDLSEDFTSPPLALSEVCAHAGQSRASVGSVDHAHLNRLLLAKAIQHRLGLFLTVQTVGISLA